LQTRHRRTSISTESASGLRVLKRVSIGKKDRELLISPRPFSRRAAKVYDKILGTQRAVLVTGAALAIHGGTTIGTGRRDRDVEIDYSGVISISTGSDDSIRTKPA